MAAAVGDGSDVHFLYPTSRLYLFDETCEKIVRALEEREWIFPGIEVEFSDYGPSSGQYRYVSKITGENFKLWFCRIQERLNPNLNNIAAVSELIIPKKELHVYSDSSGPSFVTYVGDDWETDKETFMTKPKVDSKLRGQPKTYLKYSGRCNPPDERGRSSAMYAHRLNPYLVNNTDLNREYAAEGTDEEPLYYETDVVFTEFNDWLIENVLAPLEEPV